MRYCTEELRITDQPPSLAINPSPAALSNEDIILILHITDLAGNILFKKTMGLLRVFLIENHSYVDKSMMSFRVEKYYFLKILCLSLTM